MGYKGDGKPADFYPHGTSMAGHTVPANDEYRQSDKINTGLNFPILGIINKVYFSDLSTNRSNSDNNSYSSNVTTTDLDKDGFYKTSEFVTNEKGYRLEVDVKIVRGPQGVANSGTIERNVPVCISFGGIKNYGFVVPTPTTNVSVPQYTGTENGDWCLVQYIGGDSSSGVVTHIWPNQLNVLDAPIADEEIFAYARVAGTQLIINKEGNFTLDARNAGEEVTTDPRTGAISTKRANGEQGSINVITRNDIVIAAGFPRTNEEEDALPGGQAALKASRLLSLRSTLDEVAVNTQADTLDGTAMQVKIQGERGSLRPAARKDDKVKITDGDDGDLFSFIGALYDMLESVSTVLETYSQDPGAIAAGSLMSAWTACFPKPTFQEGKIIEGSKYCQIAGEGTAADIGGDESGVVDSDGEQIPSEDLVQAEITAFATVVPEIVASYVNPNPLTQVKSAIPGSLQVLAKQMEMAPPPFPPMAPAVKEAGKILPLVFEMLSTGSLSSGAVDAALPASAGDAGFSNMGQVIGKYDDDPANPAGGPGSEITGKLITPGLLQESERLDLTEKYMKAIADSQNGVEDKVFTQTQLEDMFGVPNTVDADGLPTGPIVAINPDTGTYWEVTMLGGGFSAGLNDVITGPGPPASPGYTYRIGVDLDASEKRTTLANVLKGFDGSWFSSLGVLPPNQQKFLDLGTASTTTATSLAGLGANPSFAAVLAAIAPMLDLAGPGVIEKVNAEVDKELSSL